MPSFVPAGFRPQIARAASRWNVAASLLAAQLYVESNFNPFAVSPAGARGIAQFMPGTANSYGLDDPFDAAAAINAQAHLMRDLLRQFASVPLAWLADIGADDKTVNPNGGAIALGHPLGGSGARLMTTLVHHMRDNGIRYGLQTMCEGGGRANATILELA